MVRYVLPLGLLALLSLPFLAWADEPTQPVPSNAGCAVAADLHWTPQEVFVWSRACAGEIADFNTEPGYGGDLDPKQPQGLPDNRVLSAAFIETVLLTDKYRHALTRNGLRISGARFTEKLDLRNAELAHEFWLDHSLLEKGANFRGLRSTRRITLDGTRVVGPLDMVELRVDGDLSMHHSKLAHVKLAGADIGETLSMYQSEIASADLSEAHIGGLLTLEQSEIGGYVDISLARIGGSLDLYGCHSSGQLDMTFIEIGGALIIGNGQFTSITLSGAHVHGQFGLMQSEVSGTAMMAGLQVDGNLAMQGSQFATIMFVNAHVLGNLSLADDKVTGSLVMENLQLGGVLEMNRGQFAGVDLESAHIGGYLALIAAKVRGKLDMYKLQVGSSVNMNGKAEFAEISLLDARIGGLLNLRSARLAGALDAESIDVTGDVFLDGGAEFSGKVNFLFSKIGEIQLGGGIFHADLDLTGAQVKSVLVLGSPTVTPAHWIGSPGLFLTNAMVDTIQDTRDAWPGKTDLTGFTYHSLTGIFSRPGDRMADRPVVWFQSWLAKAQYSSQPYEQLASVLRAEGRPEAADQILYVSKQNERKHAGWTQWLWMTALDWTVGYGYYIWRALAWAAGFVVIGVIVLRVSGQGRRHGMPYGIAYSFDLLLPIIQLRKMHYDIDLSGWARYYFYFHKIMGYVLGSFLVIGISGLVK